MRDIHPAAVGDHAKPFASMPRSSRWLVLGVTLSIQVASSVVATGPAVLLPLVKAEYHLTFAQAGAVVNLSLLGGFFSMALAGWAVDAVGDRFVLVLGGVVVGVGAVASALAPTFLVLLAGLMVIGVGIGMGTPAGSVAVRSAFPLRLRGTVMGLRQTGFPLGSFLAALILPSVALNEGWRGALGTAGVASIVVTIAGLGMYRPAPRASSAGARKVSLLGALSRDITVAATSGTFLVAAQMSLLTYLVAYLIHDRGFSIASAALYLALAQLAGVAGRVMWGIVSDRFLAGSRRQALLLAGATGALGSLALAALPTGFSFPVIVVAILVCAVGAVGWNGVQISLLSELARPGSEGRSIGLGLMIQQPGVVMGPFLFGLIIDTTGSFRPAWFLLTAFLGVAVLIATATREVSQLQTIRS